MHARTPMTPHTPRHAPQLGAHLHVMANEARIDARDAMHEDMAAFAICTDADAARCPRHRRGSTQPIAWRTQSSPCASIRRATQDRRIVREDGLCSFDTRLQHALFQYDCALVPIRELLESHPGIGKHHRNIIFRCNNLHSVQCHAP
ncbi:hypothetical protein XCV1063 [Xanthomonas euvesicatoria pv. vesicatoria str. 85-10]|uniref:Uncharacterized protein n=1 Tax=Xanthomonas euvesicatoria pv. vesicatoria (strain 85-10) TaxID=316273 RepID=Q3BWR9_XANE5|nr:hypothetical protein XCV1063 [Xanthomonas euvesicatoria pv. vesicatoria str. 85-10]